MSTPDTSRPTVMIVGAGLGGLTLGALLQEAGVPYEIFERSAVSNPIGSAIALGSAVMPMFKQLGIFDHLAGLSKPIKRSRAYDAQGKLVLDMDFDTGTVESFLIGRPALYELLLSLIPKNRIHYGKKLLSHQETGSGVILRFSDGSELEGNILVGADGANSGVRQCLYKQLDRLKVLPASDKLPLKYSSISLVGHTLPLDPEKYPFLKNGESLYDLVLGDNKPYMSVALSTGQNTICWNVVEFLDKESAKLHDSFRNSEWGPEAAEEMAKREDVPQGYFPRANMTIGDLIDLTPKHLMSKVMLEEKLFQTWTYERTVLLGDACHKMAPSAGQGAVNAMLDALILANHIETLHTNDPGDIKAAFAAYKNERFESAKGAVGASAFSTLTMKQGWGGNLLRTILRNAPQWFWNTVATKAGGYRPQAAFLPPYEDKGTFPPIHQPSLHLEKTTRRTAAIV